MKQNLFLGSFAILLVACTDQKAEVKGASTTSSDSTGAATVVELPYTAEYSSQWTNDVPDADLKTVLMTYKYWENGDINGLGTTMGDTVTMISTDGVVITKPRADIMAIAKGWRDSLQSVKVKMSAWNKMYSTDKKERIIATWYDVTDTYKNGKVDSASYHEVNLLRNGKIVWFSQFRQPKH